MYFSKYVGDEICVSTSMENHTCNYSGSWCCPFWRGAWLAQLQSVGSVSCGSPKGKEAQALFHWLKVCFCRLSVPYKMAGVRVFQSSVFFADFGMLAEASLTVVEQPWAEAHPAPFHFCSTWPFFTRSCHCLIVSFGWNHAIYQRSWLQAKEEFSWLSQNPTRAMLEVASLGVGS